MTVILCARCTVFEQIRNCVWGRKNEYVFPTSIFFPDFLQLDVCLGELFFYADVIFVRTDRNFRVSFKNYKTD